MAKTVLALLLLIPFITGCSKNSNNSTPAPGKDYAALFKNSIWTGLFVQNIGDVVSYPYSLEFVTGDSVVLRVSWDGEFPGKFKLDGNKIKLDFYNITTTATITDADTLSNFENPPNYGLKFLSGKLNKNKVESLNNTSWQGINPHRVVGDTLRLDFNAGSTVLINKTITTPYTSKANRLRFGHGGGPYFEADYYMFLMHDNTLIGQREGGSAVYNAYFIATKL